MMLNELTTLDWIVIASLLTLVAVFNPWWLWQQSRQARGHRRDLEVILQKDEQAPLLPASIWSCPLQLPMPSFAGAIGSAIAMLLMWYLIRLLLVHSDTSPSGLRTFDTFMFIILVLPFVTCFIRLSFRLLAKLSPSAMRPGDAPRVAAMRQARFDAPFQPDDPSTFNRLSTAWTDAGLNRPRTILDVAFLPALITIPLDDRLREPAVVTSRGGIHTILTRLGLVYMAIVLVLLFAHWITWLDLDSAAVGLCMAGFIVFTLVVQPLVFPLIPFYGRRRAPIIAGPGFIHVTDGPTWTSAESTMILRSNGWRHGPDQPILVWLGSPDSDLTLCFRSTLDKDFITLWTMWNSLDPRPELAEQAE